MGPSPSLRLILSCHNLTEQPGVEEGWQIFVEQSVHQESAVAKLRLEAVPKSIHRIHLGTASVAVLNSEFSQLYLESMRNAGFETMAERQRGKS